MKELKKDRCILPEDLYFFHLISILGGLINSSKSAISHYIRHAIWSFILKVFAA